MVALKNLGQRICIIGPGSNGKSTLAKSLGDALNIKVCYLDQLAHIPYTKWQRIDKKHLEAEHKKFLEENDKWIIEGNYSSLMKDRFRVATSIIWLDYTGPGSLFRYIKRSVINSPGRPGNLPGAKQQFSWKQVKYMLFTAPKNRVKYKKLVAESNATLVYIDSFHLLKKYYRAWNIKK